MEFLTPATIIAGLTMIIQGLLVYIFKRHVDDDNVTRTMIEQHIRVCTETPNSLLLAELKHMRNNIDSNHNYQTNMLSSVNQEVVKVRERMVDVTTRIAVLEKHPHFGGMGGVGGQ